jgi:hypothetical protein
LTVLRALERDWIEVPDDPVRLMDELERLGLGDGLPVIPPTAERMEAFLACADDAPDAVLGTMPPRMGLVTPAKVAANAIMAGCRPDVLPVVIAALRAMLEPRFNLNGLNATTHPGAPLVVVHGDAAERLGFHRGAGLFGPGFRTNVTVGRAIRLCLLNLGGASPGGGDRATHGQPCKFSYCIAENAAESPWEPYHTAEAGLAPDDSAVTVFAGENPHNVNNHVGDSAEHILGTVASTMTHIAANSAYFTQGEIFVVLSPEHAHTVAASGYSRRDAQRFLFEHARQERRVLERGGMWGMQTWPDWMAAAGPRDRLPPGESARAFKILVAGGPGKHSLVIQGFGLSNCGTSRFAFGPRAPKE